MIFYFLQAKLSDYIYISINLINPNDLYDKMLNN